MGLKLRPEIWVRSESDFGDLGTQTSGLRSEVPGLNSEVPDLNSEVARSELGLELRPEVWIRSESDFGGPRTQISDLNSEVARSEVSGLKSELACNSDLRSEL